MMKNPTCSRFNGSDCATPTYSILLDQSQEKQQIRLNLLILYININPIRIIFILKAPKPKGKPPISHMNPPQPPKINTSKLSENEIFTLASKFKNIQIPDIKIELPIQTLQENHERWNHSNSLMATVLFGDALDPADMIFDLKTAWKLPKLEILIRKPNRFACNFTKPQDRSRVELRIPMLLKDKFLVVLQPFSADMDDDDINPHTIPVWMRFEGLHYDQTSEEAIRGIASGIGEVISIYPTGIKPNPLEGYKARIKLNIAEKIKKNAAVTTLKGLSCVEFIYTDLPDECFCTDCRFVGFHRLHCSCIKQLENSVIERGVSVPTSYSYQPMEPGRYLIGDSSGNGVPLTRNQPIIAANLGLLEQNLESNMVVDSILDPIPTQNKPPHLLAHQSVPQFLPHLCLPNHFQNNQGEVEKRVTEEGLLVIGESSNRNNKKKRKMLVEMNNSMNIQRGESNENLQNQPPISDFNQALAILTSPNLAPMLVQQGILNPAILNYLNNGTVVDLAALGGYNMQDQLNALELQIYEQQLIQMGATNQELESQMELNHVVASNFEGNEGSLRTVDQLGGVESRVMGSQSAQSVVNQMPLDLCEIHSNQVHLGAETPQ